MAENKKYYWLKLKENFFDDDTISFIEEQKNGILYVNFYLKICLKSLKTEGNLIRLVGENLIPYDVNSLAKLTNTPVDTVRVAMDLFEKIGLVKIQETGEIYLAQIKEMIGKETDKAELMRRKRAKDKLIGNIVTQMLPRCYPEIEKDIDKEKETEIEKDTNIEIINDWEIKFDKFYKNYPKKVQKQNVKKWFKKNNPNDELFNIILNKLEEFKQSNNWKKDNGQYIPYPTTWLNQKRWEDETIKQKSGFDDFIDMWKEAKDEEERNDTDNNTFSW